MTVPDEGPQNGDWREASDAALARGMQLDAGASDSEAAWREFYRRHLPHVKAFVAKRARDHSGDEQDDFVTATVLRLQKHIAKYVDRGNTLKSWCLKIADRVILDYRRGRPVLGMRQAPRAVELVSFEEVAEILGTDPFDDEVDLAGPAPEARDGHPQEPSHSELVVQAFDSLNEVDRTILWGTLVDGESDKYLAKVTGKPEDQIRKIRYKAIAKLRKAFDRLVLGARQAS